MTQEILDTWFREAKLFIFDLDGTLYEDTDHFDYYASLLQQNLPTDKQQAFASDYSQMKAGKHPVTIGKAYDVERDAVITIDPMTEKATAVQDWNGSEWLPDMVQQVYPNPLHFNFEKMIAIGDGWWLPQVTARHYGLTARQVQDCYNKTKEYMVTDEFQLTKTPGLKDGLIHLGRQKNLVLVTNSEIDDVTRLLKELDLENLFDDIVPLALKPANTKKHFHSIMSRYGASPGETVSIGDNFINEIAPALALGMKAVYIQPYRREETNGNLCIVRSLANVFANH